MIVDAGFSPHEVIVHNPEKEGPDDLLHTLGLMQVCHYDFNGETRQGQIVVAIKVIAEVDAFFRQAYEMKFPINRVVPVSAPEYKWNIEKLLSNNVTTGFNYRNIENTDKLSKHAQGLAFDVNPIQNGTGWKPDSPGSFSAEHPLVMLMEGFGWEWGGNTAYGHFQKS